MGILPSRPEAPPPPIPTLKHGTASAQVVRGAACGGWERRRQGPCPRDYPVWLWHPFSVLLAIWASIVGWLGGEDEAARGHEHATDALTEGDLHVGHLMGRFAPELADRFLHGEHAVGTGVGV